MKLVRKVKRFEINFEQAGAESESREDYYLFELGRPFRLEQTISGVPALDAFGRSFRHSIKLTTLDRLDAVVTFEEIVSV